MSIKNIKKPNNKNIILSCQESFSNYMILQEWVTGIQGNKIFITPSSPYQKHDEKISE